MSINHALSERLEQIAQMLELLGEDVFRIRAHTRASAAILGLSEDAGELAKDKKRLLAIEGIGPKIADKIIEFAGTGRIREHEELKERVPPGLIDVLRIPGLGPKTVQAL